MTTQGGAYASPIWYMPQGLGRRRMGTLGFAHPASDLR